MITTVAVGDYPRALTYNPTNNKVYCANEIGGVTIIGGESNSVITTVVVGYESWALCYNPVNNKIYCANYGSNSVTIIDGISNSVITTVTVGSDPRALTYNPTNNKVYCANSEYGNVTVIDGGTNSVITTIPVGDEPRAFCWNSIQNRIYVANYNSSSISVIRDVMPGIEEHTTLDAICSTTLEVYPNPAKSQSVIRYTLPTEGKVSLLLYDISGRLVKSLVNGQKQPGNYSITLNSKLLSSGIYFLALQTQEKRIIERLIIIK